jgi:hypothetical protein
MLKIAEKFASAQPILGSLYTHVHTFTSIDKTLFLEQCWGTHIRFFADLDPGKNLNADLDP